MVGSRVANSRSFASHLRFGQRVEQGGFAGIGVADQRHHRVRHALARLAVQAAGALDLFQFLADLGDALADQAAVGFDLGFARPAQKAEAAALALQMGPAAHQPAALIGQMGELNLKPPFARLGALAEDFQDQRRAVEHLGLPGPLQIALLDRRQLRIDDDHLGLARPRFGRDIVDLAAADQRGRRGARERDDMGSDHVETDGRGQAHGFLEPRSGIAAGGIADACSFRAT